MHEVLVNRLGGLSLPRKSVVRLTDRPDMTLDVYRGRKTTMQQHNATINFHCLDKLLSIQIELAFSFNILSDTPDCFRAESLHMYAESWSGGGFI